MFAEEFVIFTCTAYIVHVMIITSSLMGRKQQKKIQQQQQHGDRINAEIVHFYANIMQKMHHQNFNMSQDTRC